MRRSWARLEVVPGTAAGFAVLVAGLVLVGWAFGIEPLKRIPPGRVAMSPMTAVAFVFAGVSLWLRRSAEPVAPSFHRLGLARLTAAIVIVIGGLKLAAVTLGWDVGVVGWLFADRLASGDSALPSRMAPNTALNFVLLGLALLTLDVTTRRARRPAEILASGIFLIALVALAGYAYRVPEFSGVANFVPMALHTAVAFAVLAFGIFAARPHAGMMAVITGPSLGGVMARRLLPATVLALLALGWLRLEGERHGYYGANLGVALYTVTIVAVISVLIWWSAKALHVAEVEQRRLAEHQRASDERVRLLLDSTAEAIYGIDADGLCTFTNRACEELLGYADSKDLLGKNMHELTHHARVDGTPYPSEQCPIYQSVRTDTPAHVDDEVFWRADGSSIAIEYWSHPLRRDGRPVGAVVTFLDITARKEAETQLRQSEEMTRAIIATASDAFVAIDANGIIIDWNARAEGVFGWSRAEAIGRRMAETIVPPQHRHAHERGLARYLATGEGPILNKPIEITALHRDGHEFPIELTIWPITSGERTSFNAFVRDITERNQAAQSILALNAELAENSAQLEQSNRELEAFSYTISHDLRAPLRHIDGYALMLREDAEDHHLSPDMHRYLVAIGDSARHMGTLIDDLLAFSRLGRKPLERIDVDMTDLASRALQEAGNGAVAANIVLEPLPEAYADPVLLRQVWVNLLSNALKYSAPRGGAARVEITGEREDGLTRYRVRDNGVGFDMRYADKLFGVFQRLHSQEEFEGTGVGLAIVQRILARHGGRIFADATPGHGATFTIEIPAREAVE